MPPNHVISGLLKNLSDFFLALNNTKRTPMTTDWSATGAMISGFGSWAQAAATVAAVIIATNTFRSWKRQKITERHMYQAENILAATYRAQLVLIEFRNPVHSLVEQNKARMRLLEQGLLLNVPDNRADIMITSQIYYDRLDDAAEARMGIYRAIPYGKTFWGKPMEQALMKLHRQFYLVASYASEYARHDHTMIDDDSVERRRLIREALYFNEAQPNDEIGSNVREAVKVIEDFCQKALREGTHPNHEFRE